MINLGELSGGQEQIESAFGIIPEQIKKEELLLNITRKLHYKSYEAQLQIHSGVFPEMTLRLNGDHKNEKDNYFVKKCYELIKPLVDEYNHTTRMELESNRIDVIKLIK